MASGHPDSKFRHREMLMLMKNMLLAVGGNQIFASTQKLPVALTKMDKFMVNCVKISAPSSKNGSVFPPEMAVPFVVVEVSEQGGELEKSK